MDLTAMVGCDIRPQGPAPVPEQPPVECLRLIQRRRLRAKWNRWQEFSVRCIDWERWAPEVWASLAETAFMLETAKLQRVLGHWSQEVLVRRIEQDFQPVVMVRLSHREHQVAWDVDDFCRLLDQRFEPVEPYMRRFAFALERFVVASLCQSLAHVSLGMAEGEMRKRRIEGELCVAAHREKRLRALTICLRELKLVGSEDLDPTEIPPAFSESVRVINAAVHLLLFVSEPPDDEALGVLYVVSALLQRSNPLARLMYFRLAGALL